MGENIFKSKLSQMWYQLKEWWRQPGQKQLAEEKIVDDEAKMVWADDGGQINPTNGESEVQPGE